MVGNHGVPGRLRRNHIPNAVTDHLQVKAPQEAEMGPRRRVRSRAIVSDSQSQGCYADEWLTILIVSA